MIPSLVLPALAAFAVGVPVAGGQRRVHPRIGTRALALATAGLALAATAALATVAAGFVSGVPWISDHLGWCRSFTRTHDAVPAWLGVPAVGMLAVMAVSAARAYRKARRDLWSPFRRSGGVRVIFDDRPDAYALGGPTGHVVVTSGMLHLLDAAERRVLLAHERSHLLHRHHRYLTLARVTAAAVPPLGFLTRRLCLAVERWADEDAALETGGDRCLVARTILRAALGRSDYDGRAVLALGAVGVRARVEALLRPAPDRSWGPVTVLVAALGAVALVLAGSALQVHHLFGFVAHVCGL